MNKKVLVTGGAGFIGSNLVKELFSRGFDIRVVDDLSNGFTDFLPEQLDSSHFYKTSFDNDIVLNEIRNQKFDYIFHLAALPRVSYSVENPGETHDVNVTKTIKLLEACRGNIQRFIFASTAAVYGNSDQLPTTPDARLNPKSPYALQKLIIEDYLKLYWDLYKFDSVNLRFFNVFGPNQLGNSPYSTVVSAWINSIMKGESMRSDGDGTQTRDMCYVDNVVDACIKAADVKNPLRGTSLNIACGESVSNKQIRDYLIRRFPEATFHNAPWRAGDVMHTLADIEKTRNLIGYEPKVLFTEGLDRTIQWYVENWKLISCLSNY